jgi:Second Messenger Oligonucleotide or Dinucleotide Synthetase domain
MAKTIDEAFRKLRANLEITGLQEATVATRQQRIRGLLEADFTVLDTFLGGSYRRNTMIAPLSEADVDIFIVLHPDHYAATGQQTLLKAVRNTLIKTYTRTPSIRPDGHAVTVTFKDFKADVVPGFKRRGGGYLIPDAANQRWIATDPKKHVEIWTAANKDHDGKLVPLLKILKGWNKSRNLLKSFHLETIALHVLNNVNITNYPSGVRFVLDHARKWLDAPLADPAGFSSDIGAHLCSPVEIEAVRSRLAWAVARAREAETLTAQGKISAAFDKWSLLLPNYFPAYG